MADDEKKLKSRWESFLNPVSLEVLEDHVETMRAMWKSREQRGPNQSY